MLETSLWIEKYRPKTINEYVFSDPNQKIQIQKWINEQDIPHLALLGSPGTGKTSLAKILINELNIDPYDVLFLNASRENNVDTMREKITTFVSSMPFGKMRIVILDEGDFCGIAAQSILRGLMEQYPTSRFIITANYKNKIIPAIHSRCQTLEINKLDITEFTARMAEILIAENIQFDIDILDDYVKGCWPDLRKCINTCQQNSINGILLKPEKTDGTRDYKIDAVGLFKQGKIKEARTLICKQIRSEDLDDFFRFLYDNLDFWGDTDKKKDEAVLIIRKGLVQIPVVSDPEILIAAVLIELSNIGE